MARIRSVKPELRTDLTVAGWKREVRYAWVLLWGYLDDHGRGVDEARLVAADLFPLDDDVTAKKVDGWLQTMATDGPLCRYEVAGRRYLHAVRWGSHQKPQHPTRSRIPACPRHEATGTAHAPLTNPSRGSQEPLIPEGEGELGSKGEGGGTRNAPAAAGGPPPPCRRHPNGNPDDQPCRGCRAHRTAQAAWDATEPARRRAAEHEQQQAQRLAEAAARQAQIDACTVCDDAGETPDRVWCRHPNPTSTARGIALVRAELAARAAS